MAAFTVFCDADAPVADQPKTASKRVEFSSYSAKENLNPRTGQRCVPGQEGLKRRAPASSNPKDKTSVVLAVKKVEPTTTKRMKLDAAKAGGTNRATSKAKASGKSKIPVRLPRLSEEFVPPPQLDVVGAYNTAFGLDLDVDLASILSAVTLKDVRKEEAEAFKKSTSSAPHVRDYVFGPADHNVKPLSRSTSAVPSGGTKVFTTPERQYIYSAFTFKTPSPIGLGLDYSKLQSSPTPASSFKFKENGPVPPLGRSI